MINNQRVVLPKSSSKNFKKKWSVSDPRAKNHTSNAPGTVVRWGWDKNTPSKKCEIKKWP